MKREEAFRVAMTQTAVVDLSAHAIDDDSCMGTHEQRVLWCHARAHVPFDITVVCSLSLKHCSKKIQTSCESAKTTI